MRAKQGSNVLQSEAERRELARAQKARTERELAEIKAREIEGNALKYASEKIDRAERLERQKRKQAEHDKREAERL